MMIFRSSHLHRHCSACFLLAISVCGSSAAISAEQTAAEQIFGTGKNLCSKFIEVVDGNWSHPLNALHFHGYLSWSQGYLTLYNQSHPNKPVQIDADSLKAMLIEYCRNHPEQPFADAVHTLTR